MKSRFGFSMIEIVVGLIILAVGFLPIYNLFRQGSATTVNNVQETIATNYASDIINFCKELKYSELKKINITGTEEFKDADFQDKIHSIPGRQNLVIPPIEEEYQKRFKRTITLIEDPIPEKNKSFLEKIKDAAKLIFKGEVDHAFHQEAYERKSYVPTYTVKVDVTFPRNLAKDDIEDDKQKEHITLYSMIMD